MSYINAFFTGKLSFVLTISNFPNQNNFNVLDFNISNDGKNLYAINTYSKSIDAFRIDNAIDSVIPIGSQAFEDISNSGSSGGNLISVSGDDRFVYVTSIYNFNIKVFYRNSITGKLTYLETITENNGDFEGFEGVSSMTMGRNKFNLYITSKYESSISSYKLSLNLGPDIVACLGDTIVLAAGDQYKSYLWSTGATTSSIGIINSGTYSVTVNDEYGNVECDTLLATFYTLPQVGFPVDELYMCDSDTISLIAGPGPVSYSWSTGDTSSQIKVSQSGNYVLRITSEHGCVNSDSVLVLVNPLPVLFLGNDSVIYKGQSRTISIPGFQSYKWYDGSEGSSITIDSSSFVTNPLLVWLSVYDTNQCKNSDTLKLVYIDSGYGIGEFGKPILKVSPNPFSSYLNINSNQPIESIAILDFNGRSILRKHVNSCNSLIETGLLPNGLYMVHLKIMNTHYYYKIRCNK